MTTVLCINCGKIKHGLLLPCEHCGELPAKEIGFEVYLSDHYLTKKTLKQFGDIVSALTETAHNKRAADWAFLYLLSEYYPEIGFFDIPEAFLKPSRELLADLRFDNVIIEKSKNADIVDNDPMVKFETKVHHYLAQCPHCKQFKSNAAWRLFNGVSDAQLKKLIFEARIFRGRCLKCQKIHPIYYDMVYFDFTNQPVMLYLKHPKSKLEYQINEIPKNYFDELKAEFVYRKVEEVVELVEKIRIFEDGLDDIEVEFAKHMLGVELGMDVSGRLHYHKIKTGLFKKREIILKDRKNELEMLSYSLNKRKGSELHLLTSMRKKLKQQSSEWPVVKAETLIKLLESEAKYKKYSTQ